MKRINIFLVSIFTLIFCVGAVSAITISVDELRYLVGIGGGEASLGAITSQSPSFVDNDEYTEFNDIFADDIETVDDVFVGDDLTVTGDIISTDKVSRVTATTDTLTLAESGTTFYFDLASPTAGSVITLPTVTTSLGISYRFVVASAFSTANIIVDSADGDNIEGSLIVAGAVVDCNAVDQVNFVNSAENLGDYIEIRSDGEVWFLGDSGALSSGAITCTDPS